MIIVLMEESHDDHIAFGAFAELLQAWKLTN